MQHSGNAFSLPFKDPNWFSTFLVIGLIALIPIVGGINLYGWMLALLDNYRQGRTDLPPANFDYIGRGANLFVVVLVYGLVIAAILGVPFFVFFAASMASMASQANPNSGALMAGPFLGLQGYLVGIQVLEIGLYLFLPALIIATERGGISGGLNPARVLGVASANWGNTLIAGVLFFAAYIVGSMGVIACCVGIVLTLPYAYAVLGGVLRYYEATFEVAPGAPPAAGPPTATA